MHVTDVTNASRTMLMNLETLDWDDELLSFFSIPRAMLPAIEPSSPLQPYGITQDTGPVGGEVPITGMLGDQHAAMVGQVCLDAGEAKNTYGTGNFLLLNTGETIVRSSNGLLTTLCYQFGDAKPVYALEGSIAVTGSAVQWLRDQLGIISGASQSEALARQVSDNGGVYFVPAFSGLFAPYWRSDARGAIVGLSRFNNNAHLARATLEAICYQSRDVVDAMEADSGVRLEVLKVDGGITSNDLCMQIQADVLGVDVVRPVVAETTALGAAYAAGWPSVSGPIRRTCGPTGKRTSAGRRSGPMTSAPPDMPVGARPCSGPWTGSTCPSGRLRRAGRARLGQSALRRCRRRRDCPGCRRCRRCHRHRSIRRCRRPHRPRRCRRRRRSRPRHRCLRCRRCLTTAHRCRPPRLGLRHR
ncbi:carbohydrate kinase, FGGY family [Mycobacterium ulcerans str. Harvey]|uniref:ATP:glycerol 3-phosphotransferase n=1 Tax=Mycobacterium ulcerans str. Harvey TaxID=1299332 RepID=A0ABP3A969_MYCUL|nr:carbohydrate kinase, FGGY family [Mycobacterium ulcerans str. Harvey]